METPVTHADAAQPEEATLVPAEPPAPPVDAPAPTAPPAHVPVKPYWGRFRVMYALLALAVAAGAAGVVLAATGGGIGKSGPSWSTWKPTSGGMTGASEIAAHIAGQYHLPSGQQLVDVIAKAPSISQTQTIPIHYLAVRGTKGQQDQIIPVSGGDTIQYSLCGLGQSCSIAAGKPSVERGTLVRREILELALYTFKYVGGIKHVIAFMPPPPGSQPSLAVYLQRGDLAAQLKQPIAKTLSPKVPLPATITAKEQETIDATTQSRVYKFSLSQTQSGDAVLVLAPLAA